MNRDVVNSNIILSSLENEELSVTFPTTNKRVYQLQELHVICISRPFEFYRDLQILLRVRD